MSKTNKLTTSPFTLYYIKGLLRSDPQRSNKFCISFVKCVGLTPMFPWSGKGNKKNP